MNRDKLDFGTAKISSLFRVLLHTDHGDRLFVSGIRTDSRISGLESGSAYFYLRLRTDSTRNRSSADGQYLDGGLVAGGQRAVRPLYAASDESLSESSLLLLSSNVCVVAGLHYRDRKSVV